jgi:nucleoid-associated protein Lsr2
MASIENVIMNDDLDPRISTGVETVQFHNPINGELMEIELGEANRKHFSNHLEKLAKYIAAARVVETKPARKAVSGNKNDLTAVREWARANGYEVGDRGRIKAEILEAFEAAQSKPMPDAEVAGYVQHPEVPSEPVSEVEGTETQAEQPETVEPASELSEENQELMDFLKANMDKDGKVHAHSLATAPSA